MQAYFDGELEALAAAEIERHADGCPECRALHARVLAVVHAGRAPRAKRRARFAWNLRSFSLGALSGAGGALVAVALALLLWAPPNGPLLDSLVTEHVDSLLPGHLISVESSDRHTVKPWFAGHADVSPLVEDFAAQGFTLVGGRAAYVANQRAAVIVYRHGAHVVNVFSWRQDAHTERRVATRSGYHLLFWRSGQLALFRMIAPELSTI